MLQSPLKREETSPQRQLVEKKGTPGRGTTIGVFEARYHGCVSVSKPNGTDTCMHAVEQVRLSHVNCPAVRSPHTHPHRSASSASNPQP